MSIHQSNIKRIFYFNVNYACNNQCIFCYSYNTKVVNSYDECSITEIREYLHRMQINSGDRVIINGGEPLLHSQIERLLLHFAEYNCEVLIYTNGRVLSSLNAKDTSSSFRFIIPIHGCREVHDAVTRCRGSFDDTLQSIERMREKTNCLIDIKVIINPAMITSEKAFNNSIIAYDDVPFNGAVHITKMADTKVSLQNGCKTISNLLASIYTERLFEYWIQKNHPIKIFDTCIKKLGRYSFENHEKYLQSIEVYFKDCHLEKTIPISRTYIGECINCKYKTSCYSAVEQYKVLEWCNSNWYENLE